MECELRDRDDRIVMLVGMIEAEFDRATINLFFKKLVSERSTRSNHILGSCKAIIESRELSEDIDFSAFLDQAKTKFGSKEASRFLEVFRIFLTPFSKYLTNINKYGVGMENDVIYFIEENGIEKIAHWMNGYTII